MHHNHMRLKSERGQSLIIVALLMVGMIGALGLALDGGNAFATRRKSQNAADAAAFAGARLIPYPTATEPQVYNAVWNYAHANGVASQSDMIAKFIDASGGNLCTIGSCGDIWKSATGVRVTTTLMLQPFFIDVLIGKAPIPLRAAAAVQSGNPAPDNVMPMVVPCNQLEHPDCDYGYGITVTIKGDQQGSGSVQWLDFGNCTLAEYLSLLPQCRSGTVTPDKDDIYWNPLIPTMWNTSPPYPPSDKNPWRKTKTGQVAAVATTLDCWLEPSRLGCWTSVPWPGDRLWIVPIANHNNGDTTGNNLWYHIFQIGEFEFFGYYFDIGSCNWVGKTGGNCKTGLPTELQQCADANGGKGIKCIEGIFHQFPNLPIHPGACKLEGTNACGVGMSQ